VQKIGRIARAKAMTVSDPDLRAEYVYLVRGFLRLATQFEHDMAEKKLPDKRPSKTAA